MKTKKAVLLISALVFTLTVSANAQNKQASCKKALSLGYTCNITQNADGTTNKEVCKEIKGIVSDPSNKKVCANTVFKNGVKQTQTICDSTDATGKCRIKRERFFNANGLLVSDRGCSSAYQGTNKENSYTSGIEYSYKGKDLVALKVCKQYDSTGKCAAYDRGKEMAYNANHKVTKNTQCLSYGPKGECRNPSGEENTYNDKGLLVSSKKCYAYEADGKCRNYGQFEEYKYDAKGNKISSRVCSKYDDKNVCERYQNSGFEYKYDAQNNMIAERKCSIYDENNVCQRYGNSGYEYTYDGKHNKVTSAKCFYGKDAKCDATDVTEFIYDDDGVLITEKYCRGNNFDSATGKCAKYDSSYYNALFL